MAIRSQLRLVQLSGSLNDGGSRVGSDVPFAATSLQGVLDQTVTAIKKIHGADGFSTALAGEFSQTITPAAADGAALGSATKEWSDLFLADSGVISLGNDQDVTLTHDPDAGVRINADKEMQFRDGALKIYSSADTQLDIEADAELALTAPVVDIDASTAVRVSNDLELDSDAAVLKFGADSDVSLTHVADTGLLLNSNMQLQFRDATEFVHSDADGYMHMEGATGVNLAVNGTDELAVTATESTFGGNLHIPDAGYIGAASAQTAIQLEADGDVNIIKDLIMRTDGSSIVNAGVDVITFNSQEVLIPGDLTVKGTTTSIDTTNLEVEDAIIGMNYTSGSTAGALVDGGLLIGNSGGTQRAWYYDAGDSRWAAVETNSGPDASSIAGTAFLDIDVKDVHLQGLNLYGDGAGAAITLTAGAAPDVGVVNDLTMGDDNSIIFGADSDASIKYDEVASNKLQILAGGAGALMSVSAGDIILGHSAIGANQLGDVLKVQENGGVGIVAVSGSIHSFGENLILSSSAGTELRHVSAADMMFLDVHKPASWSDADGVKLAANAASWTNFEAAFGEASLLDAIVSAQGGAGTLQKRVVEVTATITAGSDVETGADLDALTPAEIDERVDVFVNGQLMVSSSDISGNGDYALDVGDGFDDVDVQFQFDLVEDDVVTLVVR